MEKVHKFPRLVTIGLVCMLTAWSAYGFSAAGLLNPLPILHAMTIIIVVYLLRSLMFFKEIFKVIFQGYPLFF